MARDEQNTGFVYRNIFKTKPAAKLHYRNTSHDDPIIKPVMPDLVAFIVVQHIEVALKTVQRRHGME